MSSTYTPRQRELLDKWRGNGLKRINLLQGSVRSGKTWISLVLWAFWIAVQPENKNYLMAAKTITALHRNCLSLLESLVGTRNFSYSLSRKEAVLFGRRIFLEGVNDARAENKIRGMTLMGAYCDELTLFSEDFFAMLLSRLSEPGAKLFATTNPDNPLHWLKKNYIDRENEIDMLNMYFSLDDNTFLDKTYAENLKKEYSGVFYERFILGHWVNASGLVYPNFSREKHIIPDFDERGGEYYISVDYGTLNPLSAGLWCIKDGRAVRVGEYYYSGRDRRKNKTDEEYYTELERLAGDKTIQYVVVDPSAASFIETIRRHGEFSVKKAKNDVLDGIRTVSSFLSAGKLLFLPCCKNTFAEFGAYVWDERSSADKVIKENDHAMDDIRYFCYTVLKNEFKWDNWQCD